MNILHITGHLGGGVGTTILGWVETDKSNHHWIHSLDYINVRALRRIKNVGNCSWSTGWTDKDQWDRLFGWADVVVVHWWDNPFLTHWISNPMPPARMVMWAHQNYNMDPATKYYADRFIVTSPVMGRQYDCIKSTGDITPYLNTPHRLHLEYIVGYVGTVDYKKIHPNFISMCEKVDIPNVNFWICGDNHISPDKISKLSRFFFFGNVDNAASYYAVMSVFGYPLRHDHYGTSEIVLGEAMASGIVPVCMNNQAESLLVENGITGYLCESEEEYVENLEFLYHKPLLREYMGNNARQAAVELYDINRMVRDWNNVLLELMDTQGKEGRYPVSLEKQNGRK